MNFDLNNIKRREPLADYPWQSEIDRLLEWLKDKDPSFYAFCFDVVMSAAYIDAASGIEKNIEYCDNIPEGYNAHLGFINLCSPCYINESLWKYQKAIKPQSGSLGKLSSEVILRFIQKLYPQFFEVSVVGGVEFVDAVLQHDSGVFVLAEVKSAPLLTYPFLFNISENNLKELHEPIEITNSQFREVYSGMYLHQMNQVIPLGKVGDQLWPFRSLVAFFIIQENFEFLKKSMEFWHSAKKSYAKKDRKNKNYYLTNACGHPPVIARNRDGWPGKESISDGKTSAGMDRTDDIKKGIYQSLKIGTEVQYLNNIKTAIISNLPAYRHGEDYVYPFVHLLWGDERDCQIFSGVNVLPVKKMRRVFDYLITLEDPLFRELAQ